MTPESYQQIKELARQAAEQVESRRAAFLDRTCAGDEGLRREVEARIIANERADKEGFISIPAVAQFADLLSPEIPKILNDRYQIENELGRGGVGIVYLALDLKLAPRRVVIKVLQQNAPHYDYWQRKFKGEIEALARFQNPHIVGINDTGQLPDGAQFCVLDYIPGRTLRSVMQGAMELRRAARLLRQIAQALSFAHDHQVIHRDLKPENVMLRQENGEELAVLIDFGLATVKQWQQPPLAKTRGTRGDVLTEEVVGSVPYMAPEQFDRLPVERSDIYALGGIAYEMMTGQPAFKLHPEANLMAQLRQLQPYGIQVKPRALRPELPTAAETAILKALSYHPRDRHERAADFGEELAQAILGEQAAPTSTAPTQTANPQIEITEPLNDDASEVVISYDNQDLRQARQLADHLRAAGVNFRMPDRADEATSNDRSESFRAIKQSKLVLLVCSDAALRSRPVKQELQTAWASERLLLPLLVEPIDFPAQTAYWLEGKSTIELVTAPETEWLPKLLRTLNDASIACPRADRAMFATAPVVAPTRLDSSLQSLRIVARFTDQIWPLPAERAAHAESRATRSGVRGLGAPQDDVQHGYRLGSRVRLAIESERAGHLLLLDEGPENKIYCLCPSDFAPDPRLQANYSELPQKRSRYDSFMVTGQPGREHLLAIVSDEPLGLDWLPRDPKEPARILNQNDISTLLTRLRALDADRWLALSTYFDVVA